MTISCEGVDSVTSASTYMGCMTISCEGVDSIYSQRLHTWAPAWELQTLFVTTHESGQNLHTKIQGIRENCISAQRLPGGRIQPDCLTVDVNMCQYFEGNPIWIEADLSGVRLL